VHIDPLEVNRVGVQFLPDSRQSLLHAFDRVDTGDQPCAR
jgi:hypothetical protein